MYCHDGADGVDHRRGGRARRRPSLAGPTLLRTGASTLHERFHAWSRLLRLDGETNRMLWISAEARGAYRTEMDAAKRSVDPEVRWRHLERAHIVSQPDPWLHTCNHAAMLVLALGQRDRREALGQVLRLIVAAPGSMTGRYPVGNTGRTAAGLMTPMSIPGDLAGM